MTNGRGNMSESNGPLLALESWSITVDLNDGTDFIIGAGDIEENIRDEVRDLVEQAVEIHIDHLRGKYGGEVPDAVKSKPKFSSWYQRPDGSLVPLVEAKPNLKNAASEPEEEEDLHAQNSKRFVDYEKK